MRRNYVGMNKTLQEDIYSSSTDLQLQTGADEADLVLMSENIGLVNKEHFTAWTNTVLMSLDPMNQHREFHRRVDDEPGNRRN